MKHTRGDNVKYWW